MIGCDIVRIDRFKDLAENESFLKKYFAMSEIEYIKTKTKKAQTVAGLFACKEAFLKAVGLGIGRGLSLFQIEILHDKNGAPSINFTPEINYYISKLALSKVSVSISHDEDYAFAVCQID